MKTIIGDFNREQEIWVSYVQQSRVARKIFNRLPVEVRTIESHSTNFSCHADNMSLKWTFKGPADDGYSDDEGASGAVAKLLAAGFEFIDQYTLEDDNPEIWSRHGILQTTQKARGEGDPYKVKANVIGFSRPIGYDIVDENEIVPASEARIRTTKTVKCNFK